jgi:opacity protein-like surface antigen
MRKWITLLMTLLVGCGSYANANVGQVSFEAGYRHDSIDWRTRFPSDDPFIRTSTKFQDLDIFQIGIHGRSTIGCNFYVRGSAYWGWILDGDFKKHTELNFSPDGAFSDAFNIGISDRFRSTIDDQYVFGIGAAIGYPFYFCDCTLILAPVIGYAFDEQNVRVEDRINDFGGFDEYGGFNNDECCRHTFISRWYGPFVGVDFDWRPYNSCFNVWAELEYHWGSFRGKRNHIDNYDSDFFGFDRRNRHSKDATAWVFAAGVDYDLCNCWTIGLSVKFQDWSANRHHRECHDGDFSYEFGSFCDHRYRDNNKWRSYAINLTFGRDF